MPATPQAATAELTIAEREVMAGHEKAAINRIRAAKAIVAKLEPEPAAPEPRFVIPRRPRPPRFPSYRIFPRRA